MAHTTERAILILCANPNLIMTVQATTADVEDDNDENDENNENDENEENEENINALYSALTLLERFPAKVQHAATMRRIIVPRRLAIMAAVRAAQRKKYGEGGQAEPVSPLLEALVVAPGDNSARYCGGVRRRGLCFGADRRGERGEAGGREESGGGKEERKGGVTRRDGEICTAFWNDTNASMWVRSRR